MSKRKNLSWSVLALTLVVIMACTQPVQVYATMESADLYSQRATEEVIIDDVKYTLCYFYENGSRVITISNSQDSRVEKVTYNLFTAEISYYAGNEASYQSTGAPAGWILAGSESHRITWGEGVSVAVVAATIATCLGFMGGAAVVAAMGTAVLGVLAAAAAGGTVYIETYYMTIPFQPTYYLYVWSFTANTGDSYGPYYYQPQVYYN